MHRNVSFPGTSTIFTEVSFVIPCTGISLCQEILISRTLGQRLLFLYILYHSASWLNICECVPPHIYWYKYHPCKLKHSWFCFIAQASSFCYHMIHWFLQKNDIYFYCLLLCYEGASAHFVVVCVFNQINVVTEYSVCRDCHHTSQIWKFCQPTTSEKTSFISFWRFWLSLCFIAL